MYNGVADLVAGEIKRMREELVEEAGRTAAEKLRADQMTEQHRMQAKLHQEAAQEVLRLRAELEAVGAGGVQRMTTAAPASLTGATLITNMDGGATVSFHFDKAADAEAFLDATAPDADPDPEDFPLGKACDLSGEGNCEACQ